MKNRYTLDENRSSLSNIIVKMVAALLLFCLLSIAFNGEAEAFQANQDETVSGVVTDASNDESLPGVNIIVKGTTIGTSTNQDGEYSLDVPSLNDTLIVSFVGFQTEEIAIDGQQTIDIALVQSTLAGEELVVVGYGTQRRMDLTGAISSVETDEFEGRNISSFEEGLQGQSPGVHVNQGSGQPGGRTIIRIRGQNSILGSSDPLYVLDGVPIQSDADGNTSILASINPGDIESVEILKDASATAIYGARGSNGVILITTKRGRAGQHRINFESKVGISNVTKKIDLLNSRQFVELANEAALNDGQTLPFPDVEAVSRINTDWQDEIFRTAITQNYSLSFSGGDKETQYYVSGGFLDQEGGIIGSMFTRGSFRLNLDQQVSERLKLSSQMIASRTQADRSETETSSGILRSALGSPPFISPTNENGEYTPGNILYGFPFSESAGDNPLLIANERMDKLTTRRLSGNVRGRYDIREDFFIDVMLGTDQTDRIEDNYSTRLLRGVTDGSGSERRTEKISYIVENMYNYNRNLAGGAHRINAVAGFTWESEKTEFISASAEGFLTDDFKNQNLGAGERFSQPNSGISEWDLISFLGRINYTFNDQYLLTFSGRRDGSSRFGEGNKWAFFPSIALAWRMAGYSFMDEIDQVSELKLRFSWGKSGNEAITPYQSLQRFTPDPLVIGDSREVGFAPANIGNPNLKWETTEQINLGLDVGLWDQRARMSFDIYQKMTNDLLALVGLPPNSGFTSTIDNVGTMENRGIEFSAEMNIFRDRQNFSWNVGLNVSANKNNVKELSRGSDVFSAGIPFLSESIIREGEPVSSFFGYEEDGLTEDGMINFVDKNGDGEITNADRVIIGNPHPDFIFGLNTEVNYKNFDLSIFLQGEYGKDILNGNQYFHALPFFRGTNNITAVQDRWTSENPDPNAKYPKATANLNVRLSDRFVEDGSYIRLKTVQFGYNLPAEKLPIRSARLFVTGQNLFTITDYSWYNPDINTYESGDLRIGIDINTFPISRTLTFGVNVGF